MNGQTGSSNRSNVAPVRFSLVNLARFGWRAKFWRTRVFQSGSSSSRGPKCLPPRVSPRKWRLTRNRTCVDLRLKKCLFLFLPRSFRCCLESSASNRSLTLRSRWSAPVPSARIIHSIVIRHDRDSRHGTIPRAPHLVVSCISARSRPPARIVTGLHVAFQVVAIITRRHAAHTAWLFVSFHVHREYTESALCSFHFISERRYRNGRTLPEEISLGISVLVAS